MSIAFLEKYKVMLSILAVVAVGGILLASTFQTGAGEDGEADLVSNNEASENAPDEVAAETNAGWETAASFDDMLGEDAIDDSLDDNGFAQSLPSELGEEADGNFDQGDFAENTATVGSSPFASADTPPSGPSRPGKPTERIVVQADEGQHAPIQVDASRISASAGGKGKKNSAGEVE